MLVLDEPTNDLDMDTLDKLEELLETYDGTLILVSHDRDFVDRLATSTIAMNGRGDIVETPGGWTDFIRQNPGFLKPGANPRPQDKEAAQRAAAADEARRVEKAEPSDRAATKKPGKLTFKDAHRLKELEGLLASLPDDIARHDAALADPDLYARDRKAFDRATANAARARALLAAAEEEWLELEAKREALASA
jgi:ATP-binding cassette subfamily F protein uup